MQNLLPYLSASLQASVSVFMLSLVGVWATRTSRLPDTALKSLAVIGKDAFLPALLLARVPTSGLDVGTLSIFWILPAACTLYVFLGLILSKTLAKLANIPAKSLNLVVACASFPTSTGPVLALFSATLTVLNTATRESDLAIGSSAILIYTAFMNMYRWTIAWALMAPPADDSVPMLELGEQSASTANPGWVGAVKWKNLLEPPVIAAVLAVALALITPIHPIIYDDDAPLRATVVGTLEKLGEAYVASTLLILGAQLAYGPRSVGEGEWKGLSVVVVVRLVLVPGIVFGVACLLNEYSAWFRHDIPFGVKLVLLLESATPPAIANGSMAKMRGCNEDSVANLLFWTYAAGSISLVGWLSAFIPLCSLD